MNRLFVLAIGALFVLAACSTKQPDVALGVGMGEGVLPKPTQWVQVPQLKADLTRLDQQGAVSIEVTPVDLKAGTQLEFEISMNTHSPT